MGSMVAKQNQRTYKKDVAFAVDGRAKQAIQQYGKERVIASTLGAILDEEENHVFFKTLEQEIRNMPSHELSQYAGIAGLPSFLEAAQKECFGSSRPGGYIRAVATTGGTGGIHHLVHMYTEPGDVVVTSDWHWGAYGSICENMGRTLQTFPLFNEKECFNEEGLEALVDELSMQQEHLLIILNTPAHNPTGYSLSLEEWDAFLAYCTKLATEKGKRVIIGIDVAYLDYAGDKEEVRRMFKKLEHLPETVLPVVVYSASKSYTLYGFRLGCMMAISSSEEVADEFFNAAEYANRCTWSNNCRAAMIAVSNILNTPEKLKAYEEERAYYAALIQERADIFIEEAKACHLHMLPYRGGFFLSIPTAHAEEICRELEKELIFVLPLKMGIRLAVCALSKNKIKGLASKIKVVFDRLGYE